MRNDWRITRKWFEILKGHSRVRDDFEARKRKWIGGSRGKADGGCGVSW